MPYFVEHYTQEMMATLLLPAGITSIASIQFKDEDQLLKDAEELDWVYINKVLPEKMSYNLEAIKNFSLLGDIKILFMTVSALMKKEKHDKKQISSKA